MGAGGRPGRVHVDPPFTLRAEPTNDLGRALTVALRESSYVQLLSLRESERSGRVGDLGAGSTSTLQPLLPRGRWSSAVDDLRAFAVARSSQIEQAFVRPHARVPVGWLGISGALPLPDTGEADIRTNWHRLIDHVPDAHGLQVLRDAHLERAHDLSNWSITDLGDGRHLVEARDLEPWYAQPLPDPDVLAAARNDFGGMVLAKDASTEMREPRP